ncbi:MAG: SdrD B-like domain-containing protein, partial [Bacteroidota bacterium]
VSLSCADDVPDVASVDAMDNCAFTTQFMADTTGNFPCSFVITRTWRVVDACNNEVSDSQIITVDNTTEANISIEAGEDAIICRGDQVMLEGSAAGGCGMYTYEWFDDNGASISTNQNIVVGEAGIYRLKVTDKNGCMSEKSIEIDIEELPEPEAGPDETICKGTSTSIGSDAVIPEWSYQWFIGDDAIPGATGSTLDVDPSATITYTLRVVTPQGCEGRDDITVNVERCGSIGSTVWADINNDGNIDAGEEGIEGVTITLLAPDDTELSTTLTDANGNYFFDDLMAMDYRIVIRSGDVPDAYPIVSGVTNNAENADANNNGSQNGGPGSLITTEVFTLTVGQEPTGVEETGANQDNTVGGGQDDEFDSFGDMTVDIGLRPAADLNLTKVVSDTRPNVGDVVTFTISITNEGPNEATSVQIEDIVPNGYSSITEVSSFGANAIGGEGTYSYSIPSIAEGQSVDIVYTAVVEAPLTEVAYQNIAQITDVDQFDPDSTPNNGADNDGDGNIGSQDPDENQDLDDEDDGDDATVDPQIADLNLVKAVDDSTPSV